MRLIPRDKLRFLKGERTRVQLMYVLRNGFSCSETSRARGSTNPTKTTRPPRRGAFNVNKCIIYRYVREKSMAHRVVAQKNSRRGETESHS